MTAVRNGLAVGLFVCLASGSAGLSVTARSAPQSAEPSTPTRSVWEGVYSDAQASRGQRQYQRWCEHCHGADLGGDAIDEIPPLAWDAFMVQWRDRTVHDLFERIRISMPYEAPESLSTGAYADIVSYILSANQFPSGSDELDRDPDRLQQIVIEAAPPGAQP